MNTDKTYAERVASEYAPKQTSKAVTLKKLDSKAKRPAHIFAYTFGTIMALLLGVGMCLTMKVLGDGSLLYMILGGVVGALGIVGVSINYLLYSKILEASKRKYASDIQQLAKQIIEE